MNSTDRVCKALEHKAIENLRNELLRAANNYEQALGLRGTAEKINLTDKDGKVLTIYTSDIFKSITNQLTEIRKEEACAREVRNFLDGIENLQSQIHSLEEYVAD